MKIGQNKSKFVYFVEVKHKKDENYLLSQNL